MQPQVRRARKHLRYVNFDPGMCGFGSSVVLAHKTFCWGTHCGIDVHIYICILYIRMSVKIKEEIRLIRVSTSQNV